MRFKIQAGLSSLRWDRVDVPMMRDLLADAPDDIRAEVFALPIGLAHHIVEPDGSVRLSRDGLVDAVRRLEMLGDAIGQQERDEAAAHLRRHFEEMGEDVPAAIAVQDDQDAGRTSFKDRKLEGERLTLSQRFAASADGKARFGLRLALPHSRVDVQPFRADYAADPMAAAPLAGAAWPDGYDTDKTFWFGTFRAISAHIVEQGGLLFDFGHKGGQPLRDALKKILRVPLMTDHSTRVGHNIGSVRNAVWHEGGDATLSGERRAPGINALARVNLGTSLGRDIAALLDAGDLTDTSISIEFTMSKSHPDLDDFEFWVMQGQEVGGKVVRLLVEEVLSMDELSIVWSGADRHAERIDA